MPVAIQLGVGTAVKTAAGIGVVQRLLGEGRLLVKFNESGETDFVLREDLELVEPTKAQGTKETTALTFKDIALPLARLGLKQFRLRSQRKDPFENGWPELATTDEATILRWDAENPDANAGTMAGDEHCFFESDQPNVIRQYQEETGEAFQTLTDQSQPGRFHFIFEATPLSRKIGPITQGDLGFGSFRCGHQYIVSAGSVHPKTGERYKIVRNVPIIPIPDSFMNWLVSKKGNQKTESKPAASVDPGAKIIEGGRNAALTSYAGKLRRDGVEPNEIEIILQRYNREHCVPPLPESEVKTIAWSIGKKEAGHIGPDVLIGGVAAGEPVVAPAPSSEQVEKEKAVQALVDATPHSQEEVAPFADSLYPYWAFNGTWFEEFANFCGRGNRVPKEFFLESARAVVGAICGHRFYPQEGRFYTFLLSKVGGIGKGTAFGAIKDLLIGTGLLYNLNQDGSGAFINIGCAQGTFSSSAGLLNNGFAKHGRIIQIYDELTKMIEKFSIPGSGDAYLDDLNTLFETNAYMPSHTKDSKVNVVTGTQHLSILGGTTFDKWNSAFVKTTAEGSGFFQRLNIISSEETETVAEIPPFNFNEGDGLIIRNKLLSKITPLEFQTVVFEKTPEATKMFNDWHVKFKQEHRDDPGEVIGRLNVMVTRNYEHLAFMLAPDAPKSPEKAEEPIRIVCDALTMEKAIALSEYQFITRAKHRPAQGANESALIEDMIRLTLRAADKQRLSRSDLYKKSGLRKYGLQSFNRVLDAMNNEGIVMVGQKTSNAVDSPVRGRKGQVIIWVGDKA